MEEHDVFEGALRLKSMSKSERRVARKCFVQKSQIDGPH